VHRDGRELYDQLPVFAKAFDAVADELDRHLRVPLRQVVWGADKLCSIAPSSLSRPCSRWKWRCSRCCGAGGEPGLCHGSFGGEFSAAYVAGVLTLADAALLVATRGRLMQALPAGGAMTAVSAAEHEVAPLLGEGTAIAAINAPESVVISGAQSAVNAIVEQLAAQGRRVHPLAVSTRSIRR